MALQAVTPGRMSIAYYQEMPGNQYVKTLEKWYSECQWEIPGKNRTVRTPTWREICETVIGRDQVQTAMRDTLNEKSASKLMCDMQMRLLNCTVNASPIPKSFVDSAFERAVRPQAFADSNGKWDRLQWEKSIAVACALETVGLDPAVGFMHTLRPGRASLALDLLEELRAPFADRFVLTQINLGAVTADSFERKENGAYYLKDDARRSFLAAWQKRKQETLIHPYLKETISWGLVPYAQSMLMSRFLRGDLDAYPPFLWK